MRTSGLMQCDTAGRDKVFKHAPTAEAATAVGALLARPPKCCLSLDRAKYARKGHVSESPLLSCFFFVCLFSNSQLQVKTTFCH